MTPTTTTPTTAGPRGPRGSRRTRLLAAAAVLAVAATIPFAASAAAAPGLVPGTPCRYGTAACVQLGNAGFNARTWFISNGRVVRGPVSAATGGPGKDTPTGTFPVTSKDIDHVSSITTNAEGQPSPMPWSVFFGNGGEAFHGGGKPGARTAGCVRLANSDASYFYNHLNNGDQVEVVGSGASVADDDDFDDDFGDDHDDDGEDAASWAAGCRPARLTTWLLLVAAILAEVSATISLKLSDGFTRLVPAAMVVLGYGVSFVLLAAVLKRGMPVGVAYSVWAACGVALVALIGTLFLDETLSRVQVAGLALVVSGVIAIQTGGAD